MGRLAEEVGAPFEFEFRPGRIVFGRGSVGRLTDVLGDAGVERALVVCGTNVGANDLTLDPVVEGIGNRLAGVFDRTTPAKRIETVLDGVDRLQAVGADGIVGLGGGSSLNVARAMAYLAAIERDGDRDREGVVDELERTGRAAPPDASPTPLLAVPTTLAGAAISDGGSVTLAPASDSPPDASASRRIGVVADERLMPAGLFFDPALLETTPTSVLASSAMNGFDKGIETLYSRQRTPITDATALRGLELLADALPDLHDPAGPETYDAVLAGTVLVEYGCRINLIHAVCHGLSYHYDVAQGVAHAVMAPHVLRYVFEEVDGRRALLARALGSGHAGDGTTDEELADVVVKRVEAVRDGLGLPSRLRDVNGPRRDDLSEVAGAVVAGESFDRNPPGVSPTVQEVEAILSAAW